MSGLEVVGSIASVVQLAGTVYAISKTLYEVGESQMAVQREGDHEVVDEIEGFKIEFDGNFELTECFESGSYDGCFGSA